MTSVSRYRACCNRKVTDSYNHFKVHWRRNIWACQSWESQWCIHSSMYAQLKAWTNSFITCPHQLSRERNLAFYNLKNWYPERSLTCSHVTHYKIHVTVSPQCFLFTKNQNERPRKKINKHNVKETWLESYADWQDLMVSCKWYWADFPLTWYLTGLLEKCKKTAG